MAATWAPSTMQNAAAIAMSEAANGNTAAAAESAEPRKTDAIAPAFAHMSVAMAAM